MTDLSNSDAFKARIAELRRQRKAELGIAARARATSLDLKIRADRATERARRLADIIRDLGGKVDGR